MLPRTKNRIFVVIIVYAMLQWAFTVYAQQPDTPPDADEPEAQPDTPQDADEPEAQPDTSSDAQPSSQPEVPESAEPAEIEEEPEEPAVDVSIKLPPPSPPEEEPPTEGEERTGDEEEIVVTGSRIKRTVFSSASPVQVVDRNQLKYSGADNASDVIQYLSVSTGHLYSGRYGTMATGTSQVNLRGLGSGATLVLLNGRRVVPTGATWETTYVDLQTIPVSAIERIEILRGGASAIYGSDAVAGVINIITMKDFDGVKAEGGVKATTRFDQHEDDANLVIGSTSERSRVIGGVSYFYRSPLYADERDFTKDSTLSAAGQPGTYYVTSGERAGLQADPACRDVEYSSVDENGLCTLNYGPSHTIVGEQERINTHGNMEYDLTNHTHVYSEFGYARARDINHSTPSYALPKRPLVSADHVDNPFGADAYFIGRALGYASGPSLTTAENDTVRAVVGLRGDLDDAAQNSIAEDWEWNIFGTWGTSRYRSLTIDTIWDRFVEALNSCSDPNDLSGCYNPFYSAIDGTGTPNTQEVLDSFTGKALLVTDSTLWTVDGGLNGSILELPGGDLGFALGGQYRHEFRGSFYDHDSNEFAYAFFYGYDDRASERDIAGGYAELSIPFFPGIELQPAGRIENYSDVGSSINPKVGLMLTPSDIIGREYVTEAFHELHLRAIWASAFRAPALFQTVGAFTAANSFLEPGQVTPSYRPVLVYGNPDLDTEKAQAFSVGFDWSPVKQIMLDTDLWYYDYDDIIIRENAQQIYREDAADGVFDDPRVIIGEDGSLERVDTRYINAGKVTTTGLDLGLVLRFKLEDLGVDANIGAFSLGAQGTYMHDYNIPRSQVSNVEAADGTSVEPPDCDDDTCDVSGKRNYANFASPLQKLRVNFPITWNLKGHGINLIVHFISGYLNDEIPDDNGHYVDIDSYTTLDLQYSYTLDDVIGVATTFRLGVINLFDEQPPYVATYAGYGFDTFTHDPRGRMVYARLAQEF